MGGEKLVEEQLVRRLLVRDGEDFALEVFDAFDLGQGDDDVAVLVPEGRRLEIDALFARFDGKLDEHRGAVDAPCVERVHKLGP